MSLMRVPWTIAGQFVAGSMMVGILAAGCPQDGLTDTSTGQTITGTLTINSNAENKPVKTISVSCGPAVAPP